MKTLTLEQKHGVSFGYGLVPVSYAVYDIKIMQNRRVKRARDRKEIKKLERYIEERKNGKE